MKKIFLFSFLLVWACVVQAQELEYTVNLNDRADDLFKVELKVSGLKKANAIYQFASTAPGTYQVMDMGRFVRKFEAFDAKGKSIKTKQISTNQWQISSPEKTALIRYHIAETFDTPVKENKIYAMCGSSIENDHVLINGQTIFGYPTGLQSTPFKIKILYPQEWTFGTALEQKDGYLLANNYDHAVDSPILLGNLTKASAKVRNTNVELYTYSKNGKITSEKLLGSMANMLVAADAFLNGLPVNRYTFLFHFENTNAGAWEHSYSSEYIIREEDWSEEFGKSMTDIAAHEFFHVVTPLNIHSEIIEKFNFVTPTPSEHLWLYEGTTEWASHKMQLCYSIKTLNEYFAELKQKVTLDSKYYDKNYSLSKLSLTSYTPEGQKQYGNIYMRGALVAGLLDIRLLELSNGQKGLREVINDFAKEYGPSRSFSEKEWFEVFTKKTYPEIGDFFNKYVKNAEPLPIAAYYDKIGINYDEAKKTFSLNLEATPQQTKLRERWMRN
ncbi:MAG: peptidase [Thermonemataceae bacterium]|nr:peptidase [Thermonemataceae bacterium]